MADRLTELESRSINMNLRIEGIPENDIEKTDNSVLSKTIMDIFIQDLNVTDVFIQVAHRIEFYNKDKKGPRNVHVQLTNKMEAMKIIRASNKLKGHDPPMFINFHYTKDVLAKRKILLPILKKARELKYKAYLNDDKLLIDRELYTVDTLNLIPFDTSEINTREGASSIAFHGRLAYFSNFNKAKFTLDGQVFYCVEQYLQYHKALLVNDNTSATRIMISNDPVEMKHTGDKLKPHGWQQNAVILVKKAVFAKFSQNSNLKAILLSTGTKRLAEASKDPFWGCGKKLYDDDVLKIKCWKKSNQLGKILEAVRSELQ